MKKFFKRLRGKKGYGFALLLWPLLANAQDFEYALPRLVVGGSGALFRISLDQFESVYQSRLGPSYGGFAGIRVYTGHYLLFKYANFQQDGKTGTHAESGLNLRDAKWQEQWYNLGVRIHPFTARRTQSYYGFGVVFYDVQEQPQLSVFSSTSEEKKSELGNGFFLELGIEYFLHPRLAPFFELEVSSGGVRGKTGFEAFSVGGFRFALGVNWWPF